MEKIKNLLVTMVGVDLLGFGDPIKGLGISYVTSYLNPTMGSDNRASKFNQKIL